MQFVNIKHIIMRSLKQFMIDWYFVISDYCLFFRHAIWTIRFDTMTAGMSDVVQACSIRRISTCNSVQSKNRHATTWKWYKEMNDNCEELALDKSQVSTL